MVTQGKCYVVRLMITHKQDVSMQSWPYLTQVQEAPNYVCKMISSSDMANHLSHLNEGEPKIHYVTSLLPPSWIQHTSDALNYLTFPKIACFMRSQAFVFALSSSWEVFPPGVDGDLNFP